MLQGLSLLLGRQAVWGVLLSLAGCLAIYWIVRGSLPVSGLAPEDDPDAPSPSLRERSLLLITVGLSLVLAGGLVAMMFGIPWSVPFFAGGVGLVIRQNQRNRPYQHASPSLRRANELSQLFLNTSLLAGILIVGNVAAFRYGGQGIDLTRERSFSLSSLTLNQLNALEHPVTFRVVYGGGERATRQLDRVVQLLELYRASNPGKISVDLLNRWTDRARGDELLKRAPDLGLVRGVGVLIEYGEGTEAKLAVVGGQDMFEAVAPNLASSGPDQFISTFKGEDAITSALIQIREGKRSKVGFLTGHGEPSIDDTAPNSVGVGLWRARLASIGCDAVELNLLGESIPEDLALLVVVGPRSPLKPSELEKIKAYAERGGPLLVLAGEAEPAGIADLLRSYNLELRPGVAVDPVLNLNGNPRDLFALLRGIQSHPVTVSLSPDRAILVRSGSPIRILGQGPATPGAEGTSPVSPNLVPFEVLRTGQRSWVEIGGSSSAIRFDNGVDLPGPATVGVAVQERVAASARDADGRSAEPKPRLVLFSCRSLADNQVQAIEPTNLDLLMNAVSWLRGRSNVVGIAPSTHVALTLTADPLLRSRLVLVPTVMAMIAIVATGILVYLARRE